MKKIYYLSTCSTCKRIINDLSLDNSFTFQDIKNEAITTMQLEEMAAMTGSYESLFSRRSMQFRARGLQDKELTESDYKKLILEEYTFLKRPVIIISNKIFVGNSKKVVEAAAKELGQ